MIFSEITRSDDLIKILRALYPKYSVHVIARDEVEFLEPQEKQIIILNLNTRKQEGSHWTCLVCKDNNEYVYFDSYGIADPPPEVLEYLKHCKNSGLVKKIVANSRKIQPLKGLGANACAWYCLKFMYYYINEEMPLLQAIMSVSVKNTLAYGRKLTRKYL